VPRSQCTDSMLTGRGGRACDNLHDSHREPEHAAAVERGRIASMAGVTALIWLAILVMMVWGANS